MPPSARVVNQDHWDAAVAQIAEHAGALHILLNIVGSNALVRFPTRSHRMRRPSGPGDDGRGMTG